MHSWKSLSIEQLEEQSRRWLKVHRICFVLLIVALAAFGGASVHLDDPSSGWLWVSLISFIGFVGFAVATIATGVIQGRWAKRHKAHCAQAMARTEPWYSGVQRTLEGPGPRKMQERRRDIFCQPQGIQLPPEFS